MMKAELIEAVDAYEEDPDGVQTCDLLCWVLDQLPGQPEGEYTAEQIREMIDDSDLD